MVFFCFNIFDRMYKSMKINRIINNNVVSAFDNNNTELVIMGKGVGFGKKSGDLIDDTKIEKIFSLSNHDTTERFKTLLSEIPLNHIKVSSEIISYAQCSLGKPLNENIYVALTDHLNFAVARYRQGLKFQNEMSWEIKRFYPHEYSIGKEALNIIKKHLDIELPDDEATFIAMHIVNARMDDNMENTIRMTKLIQAIVNIVVYYFQIELDEKSLNYERFIIHLKFFIQRIISNQCFKNDDVTLFKMLKNQCPKSYNCAKKIEEYIKLKLNYNLTEEEIIYLTVHIHRITNSN